MIRFCHPCPPQAVAKATTKPLIVVLFHGGPLDVSDMLGSPRVGAILSAGMPGQHGAAAIADILVGATVPSGVQWRGGWGGEPNRGDRVEMDGLCAGGMVSRLHNVRKRPLASCLPGRVPVSWYRESYMLQLGATDQRMRASADGSFLGAWWWWWRCCCLLLLLLL